jgi:hypothetical protein
LSNGKISKENQDNRRRVIDVLNEYLGVNFYPNEVSDFPDEVAANRSFAQMASLGSKLIELTLDAKGDPMTVGTSEALAGKTASMLAKLASMYKHDLTQDSFRDMNKKAYYSYIFPSFLSKQLWRLKNDIAKGKEGIYAKDNFYKHSVWYQKISGKHRDGWTIGSDIKYAILDGLKMQGDSSGTKYKNMSPHQLYTTFISAWFNPSLKTNSGKPMSYFPTQILSNSTQMMMIGVPTENRIQSTRTLAGAIMQEVSRIQKEDEKGKIPYLRKNKFVFGVAKSVANYIRENNPQFNSKTSDREIADFISESGRESYLTKIIEPATEESFNNFLDKLARAEVITMDSNRENIEVKNNSLDPRVAERSPLKNELKDFYYAFASAQTQVTTLFGGDPAFYKHNGDFYKRIKEIYSPGTYLNTNAKFNGVLKSVFGDSLPQSYKTAYLSDVLIKSEHADTIYKSLLGVGTNADLALKTASKYGYVSDKPYVEDEGSYRLATAEEIKEEGAKLFNKSDEGNFYESEYIESADGQAWVSIERYRDIMIGAGRWTQAHEDALPNIIAGKATPAELRVIMQPIKPFMFDHVGMFDTAVPVQHKNSEMLLIPQMAKDNPELQKILEGMGHTFTEGQDATWSAANRKFHSLQVESAVKVGKHSMIKSLDDIKSMPSESIHTIPQESYRIQMETPAHYMDHDNLLGTQIRKLIMGDLDMDGDFILPGEEGEQMKGFELYEEYERILVADIKESFTELRAKLINLDGTPNRRRFSKLLQKQFQKLGLGDDMLDSVEYNELMNDTRLPLSHPYIVNKVENMFLSMFKKGVVKRRINGGSFINATSFGFKNELKIVWNEDENGNKDGTIKHYEAILPAWSKKFVNKEGYFDINMLDEEARSAILYRIPNEDHYSDFNIKVVRFSPAEQGGTVFLPYEVTAIAGLDFDIDKLFSMFYSLKQVDGVFKKLEYKKKGEISKLDYLKRTPAGRAIMKEYQSKINEAMESRGSKWLNTRIDNLKKQAEVPTAELAEVNVEIDNLFKGLEEHEENGHSAILESSYGEDYEIRNVEIEIALLKQQARELKGNIPKEEIKKLTESRNNKTKPLVAERNKKVLDLMSDVEFNSLNEADLNTPKARDNRKIDIIRAVLTNKQSVEKQLNPGNFDEMKRFSKEAQSEQDPIEIDDVATLVNMHEKFMAGNIMTGIIANHLVAHNVFQHTPLFMDKAIFWGGEHISKANKYNSLDEGPKPDRKGRISKTLASKLAAVLDTVKDPTASDMNLNGFTADGYCALIRLGVPLEEVKNFYTSPLIKRITTMYFNYGGNQEALDRVYEELANEFGVSIQDINDRVDYVRFYEGMSDAAMLKNFVALNRDVVSPISNLTQALRFDANYGSRAADIIHKILKADRVLESKKIGGVEDIMQNTASLQAFYDYAFLSVGSLMRDVVKVPFMSPSFLDFLRAFSVHYKGNLTADQIDDINKEVLDALYVSDPFFFEDRNRLLVEFPSDLETVKRNHGENYEILRFLTLISSVNAKTGLNEISGIAVKDLTPEKFQSVKNSWADMYNSTDPKISKAAFDLAKYSIVKNGFKRSPSSISHLIPLQILEDMRDEDGNSLNDKYAQAADILNDFRYQGMGERFIEQYVRNNFTRLGYVKQLESKDIIVEDITEDGLVSKLTLEGPAVTKHKIDTYKDEEGNLIVTTPLHFKTEVEVEVLKDVKKNGEVVKEKVKEKRQLLYIKDSNFSIDNKNNSITPATYTLINSLGIEGANKEYNLYDSVESVYERNNVSSDYHSKPAEAYKNDINSTVGKDKMIKRMPDYEIKHFKDTINKRSGVLPERVTPSRQLRSFLGAENVVWKKDYFGNDDYSYSLIYLDEYDSGSYDPVLYFDEETGEELFREGVHSQLYNIDVRNGYRPMQMNESNEAAISEEEQEALEKEAIENAGTLDKTHYMSIPMGKDNEDKILSGEKTTTLRTEVAKKIKHYDPEAKRTTLKTTYNEETGLPVDEFYNEEGKRVDALGHLLNERGAPVNEKGEELTYEQMNRSLDQKIYDSADPKTRKELPTETKKGRWVYTDYIVGMVVNELDEQGKVVQKTLPSIEGYRKGQTVKEIPEPGQFKRMAVGGKEYDFYNRGKMFVDQAGGTTAMLKSEGVGSIEELQFEHTKKFMRSERSLVVLDIVPAGEKPAWLTDEETTGLVEIKNFSWVKHSKSIGTNADIAMRDDADGFIGELRDDTMSMKGKIQRDSFPEEGNSSTATSLYTISNKIKDFNNSEKATIQSNVLEGTKTNMPTVAAVSNKPLSDTRSNLVVMLARNGSLKGNTLQPSTKKAIDNAFSNGATFILGDMDGVDTQFMDYLDKIGASYTIYGHGRITPSDERFTGGSKFAQSTAILEDVISNSLRETEVDNSGGKTTSFFYRGGEIFVTQNADGSFRMTTKQGEIISATPFHNAIFNKFVKDNKSNCG